jgi:hypothetical protein
VKTTIAQSRPARLLLSVLVILGLPITYVAAAPNPALAAGEKAVVGMPFYGKWASASSHPSSHGPLTGGTKWALDVYAYNTEVRANVTGINGAVSMTVVALENNCGASTPVAGKRVRAEVKVGGVSVGYVSYEHLANVQVALNSTFSSGALLGTTSQWSYDTDCWEVTTNAGVHTHMSFRGNTCYVGYVNSQQLSAGDPIGVLGSGNTGTQEQCSEIPTEPTPTPEPEPADDQVVAKYDVDFDNDGYNDVAVFRRAGLSSSGLLRLYVTWGDTGRTTRTTTNLWEASYDWSLPVTPAGVVDFDNDGYDDIAVYQRTATNLLRLYVIWGSTGRTTRSATNLWEDNYPVNSEVVPAGIVDFDNDGYQDVAAFRRVGTGGNLLRLYVTWGSTGRTTRTATNLWELSYAASLPVTPGGIVDFDNDGYQDVTMTLRTSTNLLRLYTVWGATGRSSRSATNLSESTYDADLDVAAAGVVDFDNDGYNDVAVFRRAGLSSSGLLRLYVTWGSTGRTTRTTTNLWEASYDWSLLYFPVA